MDYEELLRIKDEEIIRLKNELQETKIHLKKYTAPSCKKLYYEKNKEQIKEKKKLYTPTPEQKKRWARNSYLKKKEKMELEKMKNEEKQEE